jgi:hypothetical protein
VVANLALLTTTPPLPLGAEPSELARWQHTRLRRRMLYGEWEEDLVVRIEQAVGTVRRQAWGRPDLSANPFRSLCAQVAVLYDRTPILSHPDDPEGTAASVLAAALTRAGAWSLMSRVQRDTIGLREMLVRADVCEDGSLVLRPVYPDMVVIECDPDEPTEPIHIREGRLRKDPETKAIGWTWDAITPGAFSICAADGQTDRTKHYEPAELHYDWKLSDDTPLMPYVVYHAAQTGKLWDAWEGFELVEGALQVGVYWTFWGHVLKMASWPQRYMAGYVPAGMGQVGDVEGARHEVVTDPSTVVILERSGGDGDTAGQGLVSQWNPGGDPEKIAEAIASYERRLVAYAGIPAADILRTSGDPRSGYALAVSREGQREAARRLEPQFRRADEQLLTLCAALLNRWSERQGAALNLPERGWRIRYEALPPTADEQRIQFERIQTLMGQGLMTKAQAYIELHPGVSQAEAERAVTPPPGETAQKAPLPGVVSGEMQKIVASVAARQIPRDAGIEMLATALAVDRTTAERLMGSAGTSFFVEEVSSGG